MHNGPIHLMQREVCVRLGDSDHIIAVTSDNLTFEDIVNQKFKISNFSTGIFSHVVVTKLVYFIMHHCYVKTWYPMLRPL